MDGRWLCLLLALAVLATPLSGEAAAETAALEDCAAACFHEQHADAPSDHAKGDHAKGDHAHHAHHAHGCGSCHVHMLAVRAAPPVCVTSSSLRRGPPAAELPGSAPAGAVFHPPRV